MNKNNFTKDNFIKNLNKKTGLSLQVCKKLVNIFLHILIKDIKENDVNLKNIGSFKVIKKKSRIGRNPKTGEIFPISSRKSLKFTASKKLINNLN